MKTNQSGKRSAASRPVDGLVGSSLVSAHAATRLAWTLTALSALLLVLAVVLLVLNRDLGFRVLSPHLFVVPGFAVVGLVLAVRRPGHAIGWLFVGMGLVAAVQAFAFGYAARAFVTASGRCRRPARGALSSPDSRGQVGVLAGVGGFVQNRDVLVCVVLALIPRRRGQNRGGCHRD